MQKIKAFFQDVMALRTQMARSTRVDVNSIGVSTDKLNKILNSFDHKPDRPVNINTNLTARRLM